MADISLIEIRAIFVLLSNVHAHRICLSLVNVSPRADNRNFRATDALVTDQDELVVILPHKLAHVAIELRSRLVVWAQGSSLYLCAIDLSDVVLFDSLILNDSQMPDSDLSQQPLLVVDFLAELQGLTFEQLCTLQISQYLREDVQGNFSLLLCSFDHISNVYVFMVVLFFLVLNL